jgi:hypothetical protein
LPPTDDLQSIRFLIAKKGEKEMGNIDFTIKGLAVCYYTSYWTIVFPSNSDHKVNFWYTKAGRESGPHSLAGNNITITPTTISEPKPYEDSFRDNVLNLSGDYFYRRQLSSLATPSVKSSILTTRNTTLSVQNDHVRNDRFTFAYPVNDVTKVMPVPDLAHTISGRIVIGDGEKVTIIVNDTLPNPLELFAGDSFRIDNHCPENNAANDYDMYEKLFSDGTAYDMVAKYKPGFAKSKSMLTNPPTVCDGAWISDVTNLP